MEDVLDRKCKPRFGCLLLYSSLLGDFFFFFVLSSSQTQSLRPTGDFINNIYSICGSRLTRVAVEHKELLRWRRNLLNILRLTATARVVSWRGNNNTKFEMKNVFKRWITRWKNSGISLVNLRRLTWLLRVVCGRHYLRSLQHSTCMIWIIHPSLSFGSLFVTQRVTATTITKEGSEYT